MQTGKLVSVDFESPTPGKMMLHIESKSMGMCAGEVYWTMDSTQSMKKAIEKMRMLLIGVLENDEVAEGFNNNNLDKQFKEEIRNAIAWKVNSSENPNSSKDCKTKEDFNE